MISDDAPRAVGSNGPTMHPASHDPRCRDFVELRSGCDAGHSKMMPIDGEDAEECDCALKKVSATGSGIHRWEIRWKRHLDGPQFRVDPGGGGDRGPNILRFGLQSGCNIDREVDGMIRHDPRSFLARQVTSHLSNTVY